MPGAPQLNRSATGPDPLGARSSLATGEGNVGLFSLRTLADRTGAELDRIPTTVKILLEGLMRIAGTRFATEDDVQFLSLWGQKPLEDREFAYAPGRVILQDFTGVPATVDLAAMRSAIARAGGDPKKVDPLVPVDLVVDHSVQVDAYGSDNAFRINVDREYERNHERYSLLRWAQQAFAGFRVVPPGMGIVHQVNLEYLAKVVRTLEEEDGPLAIPDTLVGTDSHTTMINGLGVLGWGVGGIEAEAALLGQPMPLLTPKVIGFRMHNELPTGVTATDLVLTVTEMLRAHGVVGKFVEFYGSGLSNLTVADRATISNMCPEYGATAALFPADDRTLEYLRLTGRDEALLDLVERYSKEQTTFRTDGTPDPHFTETLELDLSTVEPSVAGPRRPQDRVPLARVWASFEAVYGESLNGNEGIQVDIGRMEAEGGSANEPHVPAHPRPEEEAIIEDGDGTITLHHGSVVIAAITSCTNTSNPSVMLGAALLAKKAVERGLSSKPWVKTSMAPGSRVVTKYLEDSGLLDYLEQLGFHVVGFGCTTCIGNSGPLPEPIANAVDEHDLAVVSVLSGNRNFEGRIHPQVKASYLASPPLVVAYALAGTTETDLTTQPLGQDTDGSDVFLRDLWPSAEEIAEVMASVRSEFFHDEYAKVFEGEENWQRLPSPEGTLYEWDPESTYVREPPFFEDLGPEPPAIENIEGARVLVMVGDSVTTDHISPAGAIAPSSPAGKYLREHDVEVRDFNSYGSRRGNHEVMMRGTFGSIRLRNQLASKEGTWTSHLPEGEEMFIYDAAMRYRDEGVPLIVIAGKEYGSGSSRDWAAKGPNLLGVKAAIAESFERIHRSNLVGMGVLPLQFVNGENAESLGLTGRETYSIGGIAEGLEPHAELVVRAQSDDGNVTEFNVECRIDSDVELDYYRHGGVLQMVLRRMLAES
ncbi:MAG TPA: aconitate hydratase AcnA [Actinomycetota bacterium]|nr:aconitate hydratase AcnA [Actinomycetota bacterium]